jgi:predicted nucleic acid-binding protein
VIVVDASVVATALLDDGDEGTKVRARLRGSTLTAPEVLDLEVLSVIRRRVAAGHLGDIRGGQAAEDLADLAVTRTPHRPLLARCWELRHNLATYDAAYVALAEAFDIPLLTGDARLAGAAGPTCEIELLAP